MKGGFPVYGSVDLVVNQIPLLIQTMQYWQHYIMKTKPIPISAAKRIAKDYGYDQVIIIARKTGDDGMEHVTTYGVNADHCRVAGRVGYFIKYKIMDWPEEPGITELKAQIKLQMSDHIKEHKRIAAELKAVQAENEELAMKSMSIEEGSVLVRESEYKRLKALKQDAVKNCISRNINEVMRESCSDDECVWMHKDDVLAALKQGE